jgi:hypothetical protein
MQRIWRENGLSITMFALFFIFLLGQSITGLSEHNQEQQEHGQPQIGYGEYLTSGHFIEAVFENWESEFLQMAAYVVLTAFLFQKGSSESKDPDKKEEEVDKSAEEEKVRKDSPWPVKQGGWVLKLYENSLSIALLLLFITSFALHALGGADEYSKEQLEHGGQAVTTLQYLGTSRFWFESFQNWQSEFLSVGTLIVLTIFLRQRGSPESKPVAAPHYETGTP